MKRIWSGAPVSDEIGPVGPTPVRPGGPEILFGGYAPAAIARLARWGDGYVGTGGRDVSRMVEIYRQAEAAWREAGRAGRPRFVGAAYYALGPGAADHVASYIGGYYGFLGGPRVEAATRASLASPDDVREALRTFADAGVDEAILWPTVASLDQLDRLADLVA
jgi:alkanesulfonate monooxygenase SsuD/methylene tetrahydromethanopterin reductase-like flavin-dependent oxidoreductase (luciferase family)